MTDQVDNQEPAEQTGNEVEARRSGWVPKDEYSGDENKWVDADEFVRRGPLFEKINATSRELKEANKAIAQLKAHYNNVKEVALKEAIAQLKADKKAAYVDGDPDKIIEIDEKILDAKEQQRQFAAKQAQEVQQAASSEIHPEFKVWVDRNTWYDASKPMRAFADALGIELRAKGHSPQEVLKRVEAQVKEEFPNKFRNSNRDKASSVEGASKAGGKSNNRSDNLTSEERTIMQRFVRSGVMTEEQYIKDLKQIKEAS